MFLIGPVTFRAYRNRIVAINLIFATARDFSPVRKPFVFDRFGVSGNRVSESQKRRVCD
jgi:hypothetical protein